MHKNIEYGMVSGIHTCFGLTMGDKILLLLMLLLSTVNGETTTSSSISEMELRNKVPTDTLQASESTVRYSLTDTDSEKEKDQNSANEEKKDQNLDNVVQPSGEMPMELLIGDLIADLDDSIKENKTNENSDETGINNFTDVGEEPIIAASNTKEVRHQEDNNYESRQANTPEVGFEETKENSESSVTPYEITNDQQYEGDSSVDNSPVLQLTQGGYQRPYEAIDRFNDQSQKLRLESATQQAETIENPRSSLNSGERSGRARIPLQNPYSSIFQPPAGFTSGPIFHHPISPQMNGLRNPNAAIQNSFYNTQPDFNQGQFSQFENAGDFPNVHFAVHTAPRVPSQNPGYMFQAPFQIPASQSVSVNNPGQIPAFFHPGGSPSYSNYERQLDSPGMDYMALFGNAAPMNHQFQDRYNFYGSSPNNGRNIFSDPSISLMPNFPNSDEGSQFSPSLLNYPLPGRQVPIENRNPQEQIFKTPSESNEKQTEQVNATPKEDRMSVPFGTRIQQNNGQDRSDSEKQDNVYIRYPMTEAGYATEGNLPAQNDTENNDTENNADNDGPLKETFPFFKETFPRYNVFNGPDPYKVALENVQRRYPNEMSRNSDSKNDTDEFQIGQRVRELSLENDQLRPDAPTQIFRAYPERNPELSVPNVPFYVNSDRNPFDPISLFPDNSYQFAPRPLVIRESNKNPTCAEKANTSLCFEDPEYPRREVLYALNSDSFLMEHLVMPDQQLEDIPLVEQNTTETPQNEDNYICKSDIKYGLPLRAKNIRGKWKVIVNMERAIGRGKFVQPVRLEVCRGAGEPCSFTQIKTACVQKYSLQRLLSWNLEKGVHNDVYKLPVACSCKIVDLKA